MTGEGARGDAWFSLGDPRATRVEQSGAKASHLAAAIAAGMRVPDGVVIEADAHTASLADAVSSALAALGAGPFAVRSSAVHEDGLRRSWAGQLESALEVESSRVLERVERCRRSARSLGALSYGDCGAVAVIVQRMVAARCAGVAFSADPRTGERDVVLVDAVPGLADRLASGAQSAESWRCVGEAATKLRDARSAVLDPPLASRIAQLARTAETVFGAPQDIEWAFDGQELWLLQSRPITALPATPVAMAVVEPKGDWERDDHHGVLSPLGWDWFAPYPVAMGETMRAIGMPVEAVNATRVGGHLYVQMVMPGGSVVPPRWVLWLASRVVPSMRRANKMLEELFDSERYMEEVDRWDHEVRPALLASIDEVYVRDPSQLSDDALLAKIRASLALCARGLELHAQLSTPSLLAIGKLFLFTADTLGWRGARVLDLLAGSSSSTTAVHRELASIASAHAAELAQCDALPLRWSSLFEQCPRFAAALAQWLDDNHLRVLHYDPKHATLGERPELVLSVARSAIASIAAPTQSSADVTLLDEARAQVPPARRAEFERLLANARRGYALRDANGIDAVSRPAGLLRWFVLELGARLPLSQREHAVYLYANEHERALSGRLGALQTLVDQRRGEESFALRNRPPKRFGAAPPQMEGIDAFPSGLRRLMGIFNWLTEVESAPAASANGALRGVGLGSRVVTARARVVQDPSALDALQHGEVLVCRITSPEWCVALGRASAIVTDEGALLSHPAIIARELGLSAVLGTTDATRAIATGDLVRVDPVDASVTVVR